MACMLWAEGVRSLPFNHYQIFPSARSRVWGSGKYRCRIHKDIGVGMDVQTLSDGEFTRFPMHDEAGMEMIGSFAYSIIRGRTARTVACLGDRGQNFVGSIREWWLQSRLFP